MAWTTSGNLREFFGSRDSSATSKSRMPTLPANLTGRHMRQLAVIALATAHLALLGELAFAPPSIELKLASAGQTLTPALPWLTITGLMLAVVWLARGWPMTTTSSSESGTPLASAITQAAFSRPARTISSQTKTDPMTGLLARVSHDLRTPLNAVMGFSDLMQQEAFGPLGDSRYQSYARHIHASSAELLKAAEDTLAMTSLVASQHTVANEIVDLHELISDAFTMALIGAPKPPTRDHAAILPPVMLALNISPQLQIKCERRALRQAMINLISTAIGKVTVSNGGMRTVHAVATTNEDIVCLTINVTVGTNIPGASTVASSWNSAEDLPLCLARALLELQGLNLMLNNTSGSWSAQVILDGVSQSDFFSK
jgi:signal transduction histidine kinase